MKLWAEVKRVTSGVNNGPRGAAPHLLMYCDEGAAGGALERNHQMGHSSIGVTNKKHEL